VIFRYRKVYQVRQYTKSHPAEISIHTQKHTNSITQYKQPPYKPCHSIKQYRKPPYKTRHSIAQRNQHPPKIPIRSLIQTTNHTCHGSVPDIHLFRGRSSCLAPGNLGVLGIRVGPGDPGYSWESGLLLGIWVAPGNPPGKSWESGRRVLGFRLHLPSYHMLNILLRPVCGLSFVPCFPVPPFMSFSFGCRTVGPNCSDTNSLLFGFDVKPCFRD
jgi:hypothetical protein